MRLSRLSPLRQKQIGSGICSGCYIIAERKSGMRALLSLLCVFIVFAARGLAQTTQTAYCDYQDGGEIPDPVKQLQLSFAHMSPKQCSLRVYYAKTGAFTDFLEK